MSLNKLKESNLLLRELLQEFANEPITENNSINDIIGAVTTLVQSRDVMAVEYEKQKLAAESVQSQLGNTFKQLNQCSAEEVPILKKRLSDLQGQFTNIYEELNATNELIVPLKEIVLKGHEDLRKCVTRHKELVAALKQKDAIAEAAESMVPQPEYKIVPQSATTGRVLEADPRYSTVSSLTLNPRMDNNPENSEDAVDVTELDLDDEVPLMNPYSLDELTAQNVINMTDNEVAIYAQRLGIDFNDDAKDNIWGMKLDKQLYETSYDAIQAANRAMLESLLGDLKGTWIGEPLSSYSVEELRALALERRKQLEWRTKVQTNNPKLYDKIQNAPVEKVEAFVNRFLPKGETYQLEGDSPSEQLINARWKAKEIASTKTPAKKY